MQKNKILAVCAGVLFALSLTRAVFGAEVGIYMPELEGGRSVGDMAIRNTLAEAGIETDGFSRFALEKLLQ